MKTILHSFAYSLDFLHEQVADVSAADMVAQPKGIMNHPAWVIGHLTHSCELLGGVIGVAPWLPNDWAKRFGTGSVPVADVRLYESKDSALAMLRDAQFRITQAVERLDNAIRHALTQVLVGHAANHIGQLTVWRRAMGLPKMARGFE